MNDQGQRGTRQQTPGPGPAAPEEAGSAERLAASRDHLSRIYAAADSILDQIDFADNARFLDQVRQSGGQ
jgi:hypothetical protein